MLGRCWLGCTQNLRLCALPRKQSSLMSYATATKRTVLNWCSPHHCYDLMTGTQSQRANLLQHHKMMEGRGYNCRKHLLTLASLVISMARLLHTIVSLDTDRTGLSGPRDHRTIGGSHVKKSSQCCHTWHTGHHEGALTHGLTAYHVDSKVQSLLQGNKVCPEQHDTGGKQPLCVESLEG